MDEIAEVVSDLSGQGIHNRRAAVLVIQHIEATSLGFGSPWLVVGIQRF